MDDAERRALDRGKYLSLGTFRKNGRRVDTPVWFTLAGDRFYVFSEAKAGKMKRLRNNDAVQAALCDMRGKVLGEWIDGRARHVTDAATLERAYAAFDRKYGWVMRIANLLSRISGRYGQRAMIEVEL